MKTYIYFVRHAEPDFSIKDDLTRPLSEKGMADTKRVTDALYNKDIDVIYSSPFKRAYDTVKDLADSIKKEIIILQDLRERIVGEWVDDFKGYSKQQWDDFDYKLANGESIREVQIRNVLTLSQILESNKGKKIVIGTHGTALSTIINYYDSSFGYDEFWDMVDKMPYILCFKFNDMEFQGLEEVEISR